MALLVALPAGLIAELFAVLLVVMAGDSLTALQMLSLVGLHLFSAVALAEGLHLRYRPGEAGATGAWHLGLALALLIPGFGALLVGIMIARPPRSALVKTDDFIAPMEFRKQQAEAQLAAEAEKGHAGVQVEAIGDALKDEDKAKRLGAVEALRSLQNKQAVELLGKSLKNTVFEVRYHAVEALATINKKYSNRIAKATDLLEKKPTPENHRALGEVYHEYAVLEMEEASIQLHLYRNAVENLRKAITPETPPQPAMLVKLATCLEALGEYEQAWHTFKAVLNQEPQNQEALLASARLQYRQAQFDQLPQTCRQILDLGTKNLHQDYINVLALWAEGPEAIGLVQSSGAGGRR
jgi:tetratricopeptide (TPR) repeat protein